MDLIEKVADLTILCRIRENLIRRMMKKRRLSGKVVVHTNEVLDLTKEEVIFFLASIPLGQPSSSP